VQQKDKVKYSHYQYNVMEAFI